MITLEDFVSETLTQIIKGVKKAQDEAAKLGAVVSPKLEQYIYNLKEFNHKKVKGKQLTREVNFEIAITASEENQTKGGIGVFVLGIVGLGGQVQSLNASSAVNRISFTIPINLPSQIDDAI
jgi:hypothetical protein